MLDLTVDRPQRLPVWRVGYLPDPWVWVDWRWAHDGRFAGRWDDRFGIFRTVYVGSTLLACLLEVLADFRPDPRTVDGLGDIRVEADDESHFPTVPGGRIDPAWLKPRGIGTATLTGEFCWITTAQTLAALHPRFVSTALGTGLNDFDAAALKAGRSRELTQTIASHVYAATDLDGIRFASRHGDDLELWAVFERQSTATSPCFESISTAPLDRADPAIQRAFSVLGLAWIDEVEGDSRDEGS